MQKNVNEKEKFRVHTLYNIDKISQLLLTVRMNELRREIRIVKKKLELSLFKYFTPRIKDFCLPVIILNVVVLPAPLMPSKPKQ